MRPTLQRQRAAYDADRRALLAEVAALPPEALAARPLAGGWSVLEITEHLAVAEREVLRGLPAWEALPTQPPSVVTRIRGWFLLTLLRSSIRVPVPSATMRPSGDRPLAEIRTLWNENAAWLRAFIDGADEQTLAAAVFTHPVSGPLTTADTLTLADAHLKRHRAQIQSRLAALG